MCVTLPCDASHRTISRQPDNYNSVQIFVQHLCNGILFCPVLLSSYCKDEKFKVHCGYVKYDYCLFITGKQVAYCFMTECTMDLFFNSNSCQPHNHKKKLGMHCAFNSMIV